MKVTQAATTAAAAIPVFIAAASGVSASVCEYRPGDAAAIQRCVSQSCERLQAMDALECRERCERVQGEVGEDAT